MNDTFISCYITGCQCLDSPVALIFTPVTNLLLYCRIISTYTSSSITSKAYQAYSAGITGLMGYSLCSMYYKGGGGEGGKVWMERGGLGERMPALRTPFVHFCLSNLLIASCTISSETSNTSQR